MSFLLLHHGWYDLPCYTNTRCSLLIFIFFYFLTTFIWFPIISFLLFILLFCPISTPIHLPDSTPFFMVYWCLNHFSSFLISPLTFPWTPLKFTCSWDFSMHYIIREGMDLIIGYLSLVSLHFFTLSPWPILRPMS